MRFGVVGSKPIVPFDRMIKTLKHVEELGFDSPWCGDQFVICSDPTAPFYDEWTLLAAIAYCAR